MAVLSPQGSRKTIREGVPVEDPEFEAVLLDPGAERLGVVKALRSAVGLSFWDSKLMLDDLPNVVLERSRYEDAIRVARILEQAGARAALRCSWCEREFGQGERVDPGPCESAGSAENCRANSAHPYPADVGK
ncbi:ribosomal protein L7/L12 [Kitasatospora sp. Ki12]